MGEFKHMCSAQWGLYLCVYVIMSKLEVKENRQRVKITNTHTTEEKLVSILIWGFSFVQKTLHDQGGLTYFISSVYVYMYMLYNSSES